MIVDWQKQAEPLAAQGAVAILTRQRRPRTARLSRGLESATVGTEGSSGDPRDKIEGLADALRAAQRSAPLERRQEDDTIEQVVAGAASALSKVHAGDSGARFTLAEHVGLEAVIITSGERPSLFVKTGSSICRRQTSGSGMSRWPAARIQFVG